MVAHDPTCKHLAPLFGSKTFEPENALVPSGLLGRDDLTAARARGQPAPYVSVTERHDGQVAPTFLDIGRERTYGGIYKTTSGT
jgi:hypothetical protein